MARIFIFIVVYILIFSCKSNLKNNDKVNENTIHWKNANYIDSVQILLRNDYKFAEASGSGASAFLVKSKKDTLLCTAKHLLGEAMGIEPEIKTTEFNSALHYWKAFPNTDKLSTDTIVGTKLITEKINDIDIILQECKLGKNNTILPLTPRFKDAKYGERFEIIGCEYIDFDCHQRIYYATAETYEGGQLFLRSKTDFNPVGFSGAPVIDAKGFVIGILSGGAEFQGNLYLAIEPLSKVKTYLQ